MAGLSSSSFDEFNSQLQALALKSTRNSMLLPSDVAFHRSMDAEFSKDLDGFSTRVLGVANRILELVGGSNSNGKGKARAKLESEEDIVDNFHSLVVDSMDQLLEKTDMNLDEVLGRNKAPAIAINPSIRTSKKSNNAGGHLDAVVQHASHLPKPQLSFKKTVDNSDSPWYPTLSHKYNAKVPLGYHFHEKDESGDSVKLIKLHPYLYEITHLNHPSHLFSQSSPIPPQPFSTTSAKWVSTASELQSMISTILHSNSKPTEIAIDLEHHSYRSYRGFLCLMQLSTRDQDWVVDLCVPEIREECEALNELFTDPTIIKVFHGAESDIVWLQQDLNIYVVNLFDTFHASRVLGFPRHGLANLLEMYCDFTPDKRYQLADWRIRPLPEPMLTYARSDTHFLLYIYDNLRNALLDRSRRTSPSNTPPPDSSASSFSLHEGCQGEGSLMKEVLKRSAETSLRVYEKEIYDAESGTGSGGWDSLARKWNKVNLMSDYVLLCVGGSVAGLPRTVFKVVHAWRDRVAREEDESTRYILPNHHLLTLAESPPADMVALLRVFPGTNVPPVIRRRAGELVQVIRGAVKACLEQEGLSKDKKQNGEDVVNEEKEQQNEIKTMDVHVPPSSARGDQAFWGVLSVPLSSLTSKSSLFGSTISSSASRSEPPTASTPSSKNIATSRSALFGNIGRMNVTTLKASHSETPRRFEQVVARIHSTLVIGASVPFVAKPEAKIPDTSTAASTSITATTAHVSEEDDGTLSSTVQIELPFVPASQRASSSKTAVPTTDDTIVVVGQAKQQREKKRKREKAKDEDGGTGEAAAVGVDVSDPKPKRPKKSGKKAVTGNGSPDEHELEPFDFSSTPNILDAVPTIGGTQADTSGRKKKDKRKNKEKKGPSTFNGDFPAPPKAYSELKSGNMVQTFKQG